MFNLVSSLPSTEAPLKTLLYILCLPPTPTHVLGVQEHCENVQSTRAQIRWRGSTASVFHDPGPN